MIKEATATGKTLDIAIQNACTQLGVSRDDAEIQVLGLPRKGFLGFGNTPAKVKATVTVIESKTSQPAQPIKTLTPSTNKLESVTTPVQKTSPQSSAVANPIISSQPVVKQQETPPISPPRPNVSSGNARIAETPKAKVAREYLTQIIGDMGIENFKVASIVTEGSIVLKLEGDATGIIIGKRGETLDSLQYLCSLAINKVEGDYARIIIDTGNYRQRRQETLEKLAKKLSFTVLKTGRSITLEPMNPYERRIIHAAISEIEGVSSASSGDEPTRCVVISADGSKQPPRDYKSNRRPQSSTGTRYNNNKTRELKPKPATADNHPVTPAATTDSSSTVVSVVAAIQPVEVIRQAPTEANDKPLYGKIEL